MASVIAHVEAAGRLAARGRTREARALLEDVYASHPRHPDVLNGLGAVAMMEGDPSVALEVLGAAATHFPRHAGILANLSTVYRMLGRYEEALAATEQAIALEPQTALHHVARAELLLAQQCNDEAIAAIDRALALAPENAEIHLGVGVVLCALGNYEGSERALRTALDLDRDLKTAHHNLALLLALTGRPSEAVRHAERAYLLDPTDRGFGLRYAERLVAVGRLDEAERLVKRLAAIAPQDGDVMALRAQIEILRGQARAGLSRAAEPVRRHAGHAPTLVTFARSLRLAGRLDEALIAVDSALALDPSPTVRAVRDDLLRSLGRFDEAWTPLTDIAIPAEIRTVIVPAGLDSGEAVLNARFRGRVSPDVRLAAPPELAPVFAAAGWRQADPGETVDEATLALIHELPRATGLRSAELPGLVPYLDVPPDALAPWQAALTEFPKPRIGVMWSSHAPGLTLEHVQRAFDGAAATPISLAIGEQRHELSGWPQAIDAGRHIDSAGDLMAAIAALDAVVTVDCLAAHIAGGLGKPGIVIVGAHRPWTFFAPDRRSLFYPSLDIIVQEKPGEWTSAVAALSAWLGQASLT